MVEAPGVHKELRYRNISLHSQGKTEHGTLFLWRHHACFSYHPSTNNGSASKAHSRNVSASHVDGARDETPTSRTGQNTAYEAISTPESTPAKSEAANGRRKDIWLPYPMIAFCLLRPSHAASITARPTLSEDVSSSPHGGDELFPPTFGTSGYDGTDRRSTDSARLAALSSSPRPSSPSPSVQPAATSESARQPVIRIRRRDFQMMALHFNSGDLAKSADETAREAFYVLRSRSCVPRIQELHAFHYQAHKDETSATLTYDARKEFARMGISHKAADGPGTAWRITDINHDYSYSQTYPNVLCVPKTVSDNLLKYGGAFRSKSRIPCLSYLHSNGGSITRCSQPLVGVNKRNPQDERLIQAIFSSHTPPSQSTDDLPPNETLPASNSSTTVESSLPESTVNENGAIPTSRSETALNEKFDEDLPLPRIYGSSRQNIIVDARPMANIIANRVFGGGVEDVSNYRGNSLTPVDKVLLNIANIHVMQKSLEKVIDSFGSADYVDMKADQEILRKSGWLGHIAGLLSGSETVARVVGLGGSHAVVHCSDGWDRTSQVVALAQIMLDPHYRTLDGFISLVQKDFLSFGHKFRDRNGVEGVEDWFKIENERIVPSKTGDVADSESTGLNAMGRSAFSGAKNWLARNRGNFFNQQSNGIDATSDEGGSRPPSPPPNPMIHSSPSSSSKEKEKNKKKKDEVSPVFHQFLDTVYQLLHQHPNAFEFNERFLKRLHYQAYACQYGEFLFNNERERAQHKLPSVWGYFLSRRQEYTNAEYVAKVEDPLLFPKRTGAGRELEVRWWAGVFARKDEDMNLPRALASAEPALRIPTLRASMSVEESAGDDDAAEVSAEKPNGNLKETRSTPSLATVRDSLTNSFSSMTFRTTEPRKESGPESEFKQAPATAADVNLEDQTYQSSQQLPDEATKKANETTKFGEMDMDEGDPLGVSSQTPKQVGSSGLDFAAFASQNAFRDR